MKQFKRCLAMLLAAALVLSSFPAYTAKAANGETIISAESKNVTATGEVSIDITIQNNPGILGASLEVAWDEGLNLVGGTNGEAFSYLTLTKPGSFTSGCHFLWDGQECSEEDLIDGTILTLTFDVTEEAPFGEAMNIYIDVPNGDIYDTNVSPVEATTVDGSITLLEYMPGDVNEDEKVNTADLILVRKYIAGGYGVSINESAANVNGDTKINTADVILLRQFIAGGYGVILKPAGGTTCSHKLETVEYKAPSCTAAGNTAYWYCPSCDSYFSDDSANQQITLAATVLEATGHDPIVDPYVAPTTTSVGWTEGSHCSVCMAVIVAQQEIPMLEENAYAITYYTSNNDTYLASVEIENANPTSYDGSTDVVLKDVLVDGYAFKGWYTAQTGGERVTKIAAGETGDKALYAQWEKVTYTVTFDSPDVPVASVNYTVDTGITLTNPSWFGYTFVGWSENGEIVSKIPVGRFGNITLHANWTSNRNKATAVSKLAAPNVIEDMENGRYMFIYEIGTIDNVPLSEIEYIGNSQGITINQEYEYSKAVNESFADTIAKTVANATTKTSAWTLSEGWNQGTTATNSHEEEIGKTEGVTDATGTTTGSKYYISNSAGGATSSTTGTGGSGSTSSKVTNDTSVGISGSYTKETENSKSVSLTTENSHTEESNWKVGANYGWSNTATVGAEASVEEMGVKAGVSAEVSSTQSGSISGETGGSSSDTTTETEETTKTKTDKTSATISGQRTASVGTEKSGTLELNWDQSSTSSSTWNSEEGYESSVETSTSREVSNTISNIVNDRYEYSSMEERSTENSTTASTGESQELTDEYSSTVEYSIEERTTEKRSITYTSDATGYYRLVTAGTVHVFAVVGYDIATNSYFTYTYNVLDKERHEYLDYSKENALFNDCENAILPFEVPYFVYQFVNGAIAKSAGLVIDYDTGIIEDYNGTEEYVVIPEYVSTDNVDGTYSAIRVRGISEYAFAGNTNVKGVLLPKYVTEIPDGAFKGCTSLEWIHGFGITSIGDYAFHGCTSLNPFTIDEFIKEVGVYAFEDVPEVKITASTAKAAEAVVYSGADSITLNLSKLGEPTKLDEILETEEEAAAENFNNKKLVITDDTEYFGLISDGVSYENLQIESAAAETFISNMKLVKNVDTPLKLSSPKITLNRVTVEDAPGFALMMTADQTDLYLYGTVALGSTNDNAVLSKNVTFYQANTEVAGKMRATGNYLVCGTAATDNKLNFVSGELKTITESEYEQYLKSSIVTFDANEGVTDTSAKVVYFGQKYGELPTPTREYHIFKGWFTAKEGGTEVTADTIVNITENQTLYAQWELDVYTLNFDANGGTVSEESRIVPCGTAVGELPVPERTGYDFMGWFNGETEVTAETALLTAETVTLTAKWQAKAYTASWNTGTGYTITVNRTSSPYYGAETGAISNGETVYYGDVLSVTYAAATGYTLATNGETDITVTEDVTTSNIYATATANSYTYNIVYKSSNGTALGTTTATYKYGTTNTISAPGKTGYTTPAAQSVAWDSTSAKTITFVYTPNSVSTGLQQVGNGTVWSYNGASAITYVAKAQYQSRTATSVQVRIAWTQSIIANHYYGFAQYHTGSIAGYSTGEKTVVSASTWSSSSTSARSTTVYSGWVTVPVSATQTELSLSGTWRTGTGSSGAWAGTMSIPAY